MKKDIAQSRDSHTLAGENIWRGQKISAVPSVTSFISFYWDFQEGRFSGRSLSERSANYKADTVMHGGHGGGGFE